MFRQPIKKSPRIILVLLPALICMALICPSCAFVDLRPIGISTVPAEAWAILSEAQSPVIISFDTEMDKDSVEGVLQILSSYGEAEGEISWVKNSLYFTPVNPWKPGIRYTLKLSGNITARDGRENPVSRDIPFYAVSRSSLPYIVSYYPSDNASVGAYGRISDSVILELNFSHSMDRNSIENALKLDIPGEKIFEWLSDDRTLRVFSDKALNPWSVYRWSINDKAHNSEGSPLAKEFSGCFITDLDREFPQVIRTLPLIPPLSPSEINSGESLWGSWIWTGLSLGQGLSYGHGIGVQFSKPIESDSLRRSFSFTPSLPGRVEILSPTTAVFIPSKSPEPETVYSMRISGALRDITGLKMGDDYTVTFIPDIPFLSVYSISSLSGENISLPEPGGFFTVQVLTGGFIGITIDFSLLFDSEDPSVMEDTVFKISLRPLFPNTLPQPGLSSASWMFPDKLFLKWEIPLTENQEEAHYYKLLIPGGQGGVHNGRGSYLKEDLFLYMGVQK